MIYSWQVIKKLIIGFCFIVSLVSLLQYLNTSHEVIPKYLSYQGLDSFINKHISMTFLDKVRPSRHDPTQKELSPTTTINISSSQVHGEDTLKFTHTSVKETTSQTTFEPSNTSASENWCSPTQHVLFLKTHKTGSSTITNILNRYAETHNLTVLLPRYKESYNFQWPNKFRFSAAADTFMRPNILANHARYSREAMDWVFPRSSTFYVTILRNPVPQFESSFEYFSFAYMLNIQSKRDPLQYFLDHPSTNDEITSLARKYPSLNLIRNPLFYDLGLDYRDYDNASVVENAINTISHDFNLVLLMEHFDESLTLLKRRLCWNFDDIMYFKLNERLSKNRPLKPMSNDTITKIQNWNNADMRLYHFFQRKFWLEIEKEGPEFYADVRELKRRKKYYANICIEDEAIEQAYSQVYVKGYKMRSNLNFEMKQKCQLMLRNEIKFLNHFKKQYSLWHDRLEGGHIENFQDVLS